ncbi:Calcium-transporting ATPase 10 plasma membrane-type, partial [Bienertia sinuspersici]
MAGICYSSCIVSAIKCCSNPSNSNDSKKQTPQLLKFAVNGVTEMLRLFSPVNNNSMEMVVEKDGELLVSGVDDVLGILKLDYDNAYFVTGTFTSSIYDADCLFEDPTIKFR